MGDFFIATDSTADLPKEYFEQHGIGMLSLSCILDGETYGQDKELDINFFYDSVRNGSMPTTSQVNPEQAKQYFESVLPQHREILYLAFSSGLSGTYQSVKIAAEEIMEEQKDVRIEVIDTLCASLGEGLFVDKAVEMKEAGAGFDEVVKFMRENLLHLCHVFTVDDLFHLHRGGRVSKTAAVIGTMVGIKPLLHVDNEGHLINIGKVRGRKKALLSLVDMMEERIGAYKDAYQGNQEKVFISHSDCLEDARLVEEEVRKRFGADRFLINYIGPVIGSHTGAGTVALFFWGDYR